MIAALLILAFRASVTALIPLYAIGVFLSFTLSQAGMARRWWKIGHLAPGQEVQERGSTLRYEPAWRLKLALNGFGAVCTGVVLLIFAITKFHEGAWLVLLLLPALVLTFGHPPALPRAGAAALAGPPAGARPPRAPLRDPAARRRAPGTQAALRYARMLSPDVTAVHVALDAAEAARVRQRWEQWGEGRPPGHPGVALSPAGGAVVGLPR